MNNEINSLGSINVSPRAIATISFQAALQSYGVVGLAPKNLVDGISRALVKDPIRGVDVHYDGSRIEIDIYVIIEYGTRIATVASSIKDSVQYQVEKALGLPVQAVNVHVCGLRFSELD